MEIRRDVFQAIADPTRRAILGLVASQAMTPGAIAANFSATRQTISKHIQILNECDLLSQTHTGREIHYRINPEKIKEVADWVNQYSSFWNKQLDALDLYLNNVQSPHKTQK